MAVLFGPGLGRQPAEGALLADTNAADQVPIVVQAVDSQAGNLMEFRDASGNVLSSVDVTGAIGGAAALAGAVILAPATSGRNVIRPTVDATGLTVKAFSDTQLFSIFRVANTAGGAYLDVLSGGMTIRQLNDATTNTVSDIELLSHNTSGTAADGFGQGFHFSGQTSSGATQDMSRIDTLWATAADATRKARLVLSVFDTAVREGLRIEASGSVPMVGFLGAAAVVRQTGASAAGIAAVTDANAKAALTALQTALANLGLVTSPA